MIPIIEFVLQLPLLSSSSFILFYGFVKLILKFLHSFRCLPTLYYSNNLLQMDEVVTETRHKVSHYLEPIFHEWSQPPTSIVYGLASPFYNPKLICSGDETIEENLSRIISSLLYRLSSTNSKHTKVQKIFFFKEFIFEIDYVLVVILYRPVVYLLLCKSFKYTRLLHIQPHGGVA